MCLEQHEIISISVRVSIKFFNFINIFSIPLLLNSEHNVSMLLFSVREQLFYRKYNYDQFMSEVVSGSTLCLVCALRMLVFDVLCTFLNNWEKNYKINIYEIIVIVIFDFIFLFVIYLKIIADIINVH